MGDDFDSVSYWCNYHIFEERLEMSVFTAMKLGCSMKSLIWGLIIGVLGTVGLVLMNQVVM